MSSLLKVNIHNQIDYKKNWGWFLAWGISLILLGVMAITFSVLTSIVTVLVLGVLLAIGGGILIIDSFHFWRRKASSFFMHFAVGLLYLLAGIVLVAAPIRGAISITLFLAIFYIIVGIVRIVQAFAVNIPGMGWRLLNGIVALILGVLILAQWPVSGMFIIGLFIGIELFITGWVYIVASLAARKQMA